MFAATTTWTAATRHAWSQAWNLSGLSSFLNRSLHFTTAAFPCGASLFKTSPNSLLLGVRRSECSVDSRKRHFRSTFRICNTMDGQITCTLQKPAPSLPPKNAISCAITWDLCWLAIIPTFKWWFTITTKITLLIGSKQFSLTLSPLNTLTVLRSTG